MKYIFFTDVDGTLIDHNNYRYDLSLKAIALLKKKSIPLIAVSSKTFDEMILMMKELNLCYPFVFENGAGIAYPLDDEWNFNLTLKGPGIEELIKFLPELERISGRSLKGMNSLPESEIAEYTGLDLQGAALSKKRITTLPFLTDKTNIFTDSEIFYLNRLLKKHSLCITKGERFNHLIPYDSGKGEAVKKIIEFYTDNFNDEIMTAAVGDSLNDIPMLDSVDYAYVVRKTDGSFMNYAAGKIMNKAGPAGFTEAVNDFLNIIAGKKWKH